MSGRNIQPPCIGPCSPNENNVIDATQNDPKQTRCSTSSSFTQINSLGRFFADPASQPQTTQSPLRSPTSFPLLFQSLPALPSGSSYYLSIFTDNLNPDVAAVRFSSQAIADPAQFIYTQDFQRVPQFQSTTGNVYISLPSRVDPSSTIISSFLEYCATFPAEADTNLVQDSSGVVFAVYQNVQDCTNSTNRYRARQAFAPF